MRMFSCVSVHARQAFGDAGNAEVEDLQPPVLIDHQVRRLDVAVNDAGFVRVLQTGAQLDHQPELLPIVIDSRRLIFSARVSPLMYSMTMNGEPWNSPQS